MSLGFDTLSSGMFDSISSPVDDFDLERKVLIEIEEEICGNRNLSKALKEMDPFFFYQHDGISDLRKMTANGSATFDVTGFCIDLIRLVPEITTVWIVRDSSYYQRHLPQMVVSDEHRLSHQLPIPRTIPDIDAFLKYSILKDPDSSPPSYGFDPFLWTLSGAFCFYQGLKKAVTNGLL